MIQSEVSEFDFNKAQYENGIEETENPEFNATRGAPHSGTIK